MYTEDNFVQIGLTGVHDLSSSGKQYQFNLGLVHSFFCPIPLSLTDNYNWEFF